MQKGCALCAKWATGKRYQASEEPSTPQGSLDMKTAVAFEGNPKRISKSSYTGGFSLFYRTFYPMNLRPKVGYVLRPKSWCVRALANLPSGSCSCTRSMNFVKLL